MKCTPQDKQVLTEAFESGMQSAREKAKIADVMAKTNGRLTVDYVKVI